jgi:hypothetical protein
MSPRILGLMPAEAYLVKPLKWQNFLQAGATVSTRLLAIRDHVRYLRAIAVETNPRGVRDASSGSLTAEPANDYQSSA